MVRLWTGLAGLTNQTGLYLVGNSASDLSPLAGLTNLTQTLDLGGNVISDLSPLVGLTQSDIGSTLDN